MLPRDVRGCWVNDRQIGWGSGAGRLHGGKYRFEPGLAEKDWIEALMGRLIITVL